MLLAGRLIENIPARFTCTASTYAYKKQSCQNLYDGNLGTGWWTNIGESKDAWIRIDFDRKLFLSDVKIMHPPNQGWFKTILLSFSNGKSQVANLTWNQQYISNTWTEMKLSPPASTTFIKITGTDVQKPENIKTWHYGLYEIRINGSSI